MDRKNGGYLGPKTSAVDWLRRAPVRGVLYTLTTSVPLLVGIQVLDGVANAIFGVVSILVIADLTRGSGRFNITQGAFGTVVGIGACLNTTFAGFLVQRSSYSFSFLGLAAIGLLAWMLLWAAVPETLSVGSGIRSTSQSQTG
jgi:predicted MFS family arabinose efflux permease